MKQRYLFVYLLGLFALLAPLSAGLVYVPVTDHYDIAGATIVHQLVISNTDTQGTQAYSTLFLPVNSDGTDRENREPSHGAVLPGATILVNLPATQGMWEIGLPPALSLTARVLVQDVDGVNDRVLTIPVLDSDNMLPANTWGDLLGLERNSQGGITTDFDFFNLSHEPANCIVNFFRADGSVLFPAILLAFKPLSARFFPDGFEILNVADVQDARMESSCSGNAFFYSPVLAADLDHHRLVRPSATGNSRLQVPGESVELVVDGNFFNPVQGNSLWEVQLPLEVGQNYDRIEIEYDMYLNRWQTTLFHILMELRRKGGGPLFYGTFIRGSNSKTIIDRGDGSSVNKSGVWSQQTQYHVVWTYDANSAGGPTLEMQLFRSGALVDSLTANMTFADLRDQGSGIWIILGARQCFDGSAYCPPWGWRFSNLEARAYPAAQ